MSGNNGTLLRGSSAFTVNGKFGANGLSGGVYELPVATDQFVSSNGGDAGTLTNATIEAWIRSSTTGTRVAFGHDRWYWVGFASGKPTARFGSNTSPNTEGTLTGATSINDGLFHHVALVLTPEGGSLYVDGALVATATGVKPVNTSVRNLLIGGLGDTTTFDWAGNGAGVVDEMRVSNVARYTGSTYTVPTAAFISDANTIGLYHLDGDVLDSSTGTNPPPVETTVIAPTNTNLAYSPGNWDVTSARAKTINPGAYVRALVAGSPTTFTLGFDLTGILTPLPQVQVRVDGQVVFTGVVAATITAPVPVGTTWTKHLVEVIVRASTQTQQRWSPQTTAVALTSITANVAGASTLPVLPRGGLVGYVFGDSITEGVRVLGESQTLDTDRNDSTLSWAHGLTRTLGCEVGVIGFGGTGLLSTPSSGVPPLPTSHPLLWGSGPARSFTGLDFIVIAHGTNDGSNNTTSAYTSVLNALLAATPASTVIICIRPFNGTLQAANIQAAIAACTIPRRVTYVDTAGWVSSADLDAIGLHPTGYANVAQIGPRVAAAVRGALRRTGTYVYDGTTWRQRNPVRV